MKRKKLLIAVYVTVAVLMMVTVGLGITVSALSEKPDGVICEGISVNGIDMGGKTKEEAKNLLSDYINKIKEKEFRVSVTENGEIQGSESLSFADLGLKAKSEKIVEEISLIGETGNIIERYKAIKTAKTNRPEYNLEFKYDKKKLDKFVSDIAQKYDIAAENASLTRENGKFIVSGGKTGRNIDKKASLALAKERFEEYINSLPASVGDEIGADFTLVSKKPKYDKDALLKVTDLLGTYTTSYVAKGGRGQNVENGCRHINGSVVMPGETLSANKKMEPYTYQNGYGLGGAYVNGKVVADIGGGICQVSSTLYNAILYSELDVVQRQNHSMSVGYVPLARDAAIAGTWKDFVFKNNTEYPIYIEGITGSGRITFNVYGHETRDVAHRKVDFSTVVLSRKNGSRAQLYKMVYVDGALKEKSVVNTSNYKPHEGETAEAKKRAEEEKKKKEEEEKKKKEEKKNAKNKKKIEKKIEKKNKKETGTPILSDDEDEEIDDSEEGIEG